MGGQSGKYDVFSDPTIEGHAATKRLLSASYSMSAVNGLDSFVQRPIDRLLSRFEESSRSGQQMNLADWLQWFAFDVIGEVSFSKQFGFLDAGRDVDDTLKAIDETLWSGIVIAELPELDAIRKSPLFRHLPLVGGYDTRLNFIIGVGTHSHDCKLPIYLPYFNKTDVEWVICINSKLNAYYLSVVNSRKSIVGTCSHGFSRCNRSTLSMMTSTYRSRSP